MLNFDLKLNFYFDSKLLIGYDQSDGADFGPWTVL